MTNVENKHGVFNPEEVRPTTDRLPMSPKQVAAIKLSEDRGKKLAETYPEIADKYRSGTTVGQIANAYTTEIKDYSHRQDLSQPSMIRTVRFAIKRLIGEKERERLCREHMKESGKRVYEKGSGAFGMTEEAKKQARGKGARNRPPNSVDYHALGILRAIRQGKTPISDAEKKYILGLCDNPDFQHTTGCSKGKPKYSKIVEEVERKFSVRRTEVAYRCIVYNVRKKATRQPSI